MFKTDPTTAPADEVLTPISSVSHYRLRKNLRDIELYQRYPRLSYKWRLRMRGESDHRNVPDEHGKVRAAPRGKAKQDQS